MKERIKSGTNDGTNTYACWLSEQCQIWALSDIHLFWHALCVSCYRSCSRNTPEQWSSIAVCLARKYETWMCKLELPTSRLVPAHTVRWPGQAQRSTLRSQNNNNNNRRVKLRNLPRGVDLSFLDGWPGGLEFHRSPKSGCWEQMFTLLDFWPESTFL